jgi:hypothetical protein
MKTTPVPTACRPLCWLLTVLALAVSMVWPLAGDATVHASTAIYHEQGGMVVVEAEHAASLVDRRGASWQPRTDIAGATGDGLLHLSPNKNVWFDGTSGPEALYPIMFHQTGTYMVWVRATAANHDDNSVRIGLNNAQAGVVATTSGGAWAWSSTLMDYQGRATLNVPAPGVYTLSLWGAEDGASVDRVLLTTNKGYVPTNAGPAESMRMGDGAMPAPTAPPAPTAAPAPSAAPAPTAAPTVAPAPTAAPAPASGAHPMGCRANELWLDAQDWWATTPGRVGRDGTPGDDFGHLHTGLCFPLMSTLQGVVPLRVRSVMHHNPGHFREIEVQLYQGDSANIVAAELHFSRRMSSCVQTGGTLTDAGMTCTWWDTIQVDTRKARYDGEVQFRVRGFVGEPDGKDMRTSTSLHATLRNGGRAWYDTLYQELSELEGRGWYTNLNYAASRLKAAPQLLKPVSGTWRLPVTLVRGAEGAAVTSWYAGVDTDFHNNNPGLSLCPAGVRQLNGILQCGTATYNGQLSIDTTRLSNGWHRLFLKTDQYDAETGSTHSGVMATFFLVQN